MRYVPAYLLALAALALVGSAARLPRPSTAEARSAARVHAQVTATLPVSPTAPSTPTQLVMTPGTTPDVTATVTATLTITPTSTITPTLGAEWGVDALCRCHVPPLDPGSSECERLKLEYIRDVIRAWGSQTAAARGTDTPTPTASDSPTGTPTSTASPSSTPAPTLEPTPTTVPSPTPTPAATQTPHVVVVTATPPPIVRRAWLPFAYLRRTQR
ncbi:MAG: hypothetical protein IT341_07095 [Chloroflexi bacterium]|nr:hypothetical protein [Chloroflexota bacterium]